MGRKTVLDIKKKKKPILVQGNANHGKKSFTQSTFAANTENCIIRMVEAEELFLHG